MVVGELNEYEGHVLRNHYIGELEKRGKKLRTENEIVEYRFS